MISFKEFLFQSIQGQDEFDSFDTEDDEINSLAEALAKETINELYDFTLNEDEEKSNTEIADELRNELKKIMLSYGICMAYLGPARMRKIARFARLVATNLNSIEKGNQKLLVRIYKRILTFAKESDPTGIKQLSLRFTGVQLKIDNLKKLGSDSIWCDNFISLARKITMFARTGISTLKNKFKISKPYQFYNDALDKFYNYENDKNDAKLSDEEKAQKGITWANKISMADIGKMNLRVKNIDKDFENEESNTDNSEADSVYLVSFFKAIVKIATVYGAGANPQIFLKLANFVNNK